MIGHVVRPSNSMDMKLLLYFLCCEITSLTRCNAVKNAMMVNKAFCESTYNGSSTSIMGRKGKSFSRICVYSHKDKSLPNQPATKLMVPTGKILYQGHYVGVSVGRLGIWQLTS